MAEYRDLNFPEFVRVIVSSLEAAGVEYMIGGAVAVWAWGEPRTTHDLDVVVHLLESQLEKLAEELLKHEIMVDPNIMRQLIRDRRSDLAINAIHGFSGYKAELFPARAGDTFRATALGRRRLHDLGPEIGEVYLHSPEDLILYKLQYYQISRQPKHAKDIGTILNSGQPIDTDYIESWAGRLGVLPAWRDIQRDVGGSAQE